MSNFSLMILCAGFGKRMLDLTTNKPKPLLIYKNKTLLENTLSFFKGIGCNKFIVNTHYLHNIIEDYINNKLKNYSISIINEPIILGTGGGIKNAFNYISEDKLCVVNCDIFWQKENKFEVINFIRNHNDDDKCRMLLSKNKNFYGLKKNYGDFNLKNNLINNWSKGDEIMYYSGLQIVHRSIFNNFINNFPINQVWDQLIKENKLRGEIIQSKILHIGDKKSFDLV